MLLKSIYTYIFIVIKITISLYLLMSLNIIPQLFSQEAFFEMDDQQMLPSHTSSRSGIFTNYFNGNSVVKITVRDSILWAACIGGAVKWNLENNSYNKYTNVNGLADNRLLSIFTDTNDNLWVGSTFGISKYDGIEWVTFPVQGVISIAQDPNNNIWASNYFGHIYKYDGNSWDDLLSQGIWAVSQDIFFDHNGTGWFTSLSSGILMYNSYEDEWTTFDTLSGFPSQITISVGGDTTDTIWIGTADLNTSGTIVPGNIGLVRYDVLNDTLISYTEESGLPSNYISNIEISSTGTVWGIGTVVFDGAIKLDSNGVTHLTTANSGLITDTINDLAIDENSVYFGGNGIVKFNYDSLTWNTYETSNEPLSSKINAVISNNTDSIWVGTARGLNLFINDEWIPIHGIPVLSLFIDSNNNLWSGFDGYYIGRYDGSEWEIFNKDDGILGGVVYDITEDINGNIWIAVNGGVNVYNGQIWNSYTTDNGLPGTRPRALASNSDGSMWIGFKDNGIAIYKNQNWEYYTSDYTYGINTGNGNSPLRDNWVESLAIDQNGVVLLGTYRGFQTADNNGTWKSFTQYSDGLVHAITVDIWNNYWIGSGLLKYDGNSWSTWNYTDGLAGEVRGISVDNQGIVWVATDKGLSKFQENTTAAVQDYTQINVNNNLISYPNPSNNTVWFKLLINNESVHQSVAKSLQLNIFDIKGRKIRTIKPSSLKTPAIVFTWDGKDYFGRRVSSGFYIYNTEFENQILSGKLLIIQ